MTIALGILLWTCLALIVWTQIGYPGARELVRLSVAYRPRPTGT